MTSPRPTWRRALFVLVRVAFVTGLVPLLMAPTCGNLQPGSKAFSRGSLVIPMDVCYQATDDDLHANSNGYQPVSCNQDKAPGDVIRAYGLVYELIRHDVAVYWIINNTKTATTDVDLTIQYNGGPPALLWSWGANGGPSGTPTSSNKIDYRGGPFVIDGSDYAKAKAVLDSTSVRATFGKGARGANDPGVNVHYANVAFTGYVAKTMAGGWTAGGAVAPKLALLDIGSSNTPCSGTCATSYTNGKKRTCFSNSNCNSGDTCQNYTCADNDSAKNAEIVLQGYLKKAGLDVASNGGTTAAGSHGAIYDRLFMADFLPDTPGNWTTSNLYRGGYQVLWVPHWEGPGSCSDCPPSASCTCNVKFGADTVSRALKTIGAFSAARNDIFAECAGLGSFEGVLNNPSYSTGDPTTRFQTTSSPGLSSINRSVGAVRYWGSFASPLMQIGDFGFEARDGAIQNFKPGAYKSETVRLISDSTDNSYDIFTMVPASPSHGSVVYLAGHDYSGADGKFEVAGSRMVLNTLFNLGAACQETGVACSTGLLGECAQGVMSCNEAGVAYCKQITFPHNETCDGKDNDCNGLIDDGLDVACYDGPPATRNVGLCQDGVSSCVQKADGSFAMSACSGEVLPSPEICNGLDDACTGHTDQTFRIDAIACGNATTPCWAPLQGACYDGPSNTLDPTTGLPRGICKAGISTCTGGTWGACPACAGNAWQDKSTAPKDCEILPRPQDCSDPVGKNLDMACQGAFTCGCTDGATQPCYDGPTGTAGTGICHAGTRVCHSGTYGECQNQQVPGQRDCTSTADNDCNGRSDSGEDACNTCPAAGDPSLVCPIPDTCPGTNANGTPCKIAWHLEGTTTACTRGQDGCVPAGTCHNGARECSAGEYGACSAGILPSVEVCDGKDNNCNGQIDENPDTLCGPGLTCNNGVCVPRTCGVESPYREGYDCINGSYTVANCGTTGSPCPAGQNCVNGACVDQCATVQCGAGDICSSGSCTGGGCFLTGCASGSVCEKGVCVPDPCAGLSCPAGTFCRAGDCVQSCVYVTCPAGKICSVDGFCEVDACADAHCAPGQKCVGGSCQDDACVTKRCGARQTCVDGTCEDDPCNQVDCGVGVCSKGQCYPVTTRDDSSGHSTSSGGGGCGCGSGSSSGTPLAALLLLALFPLTRRRRARQPARAGGRRGPGGAGLLLLLALVALPAAGCKGSSSSGVDLSACKETCGENRCIDVNYDPANCGRCGSTCEANQQCVDAVCGPTGAVAPYITGVSPGQANHGLLTPVTVVLTGQRFADGAEVRAISPAGTATYTASYQDSTHLSIDLELKDTPATQLDLRVVNPDHVISNTVPFDVVSTAANLTGLTPTTVTAGEISDLALTGTGFTTSSACRAAPGSTCGGVTAGFGMYTVSTATGLTCQLDATSIDLGTYNVWVVNDGETSSNCRTVQVASGTPTLTSLSPSTGQTNGYTDIVIEGTGFDVSSRAWFTPPGGGAAVAATTTLISATQLLVPLYHPTATGDYTVSVRNGSVTAVNTLTFSSIATPPLVSNLAVTPSPTYQGDSITLAFTGSFFTTPWAGAGGPITITPPTGQPFAGTLTGTPTATSVTGTASLSGKPDGLYSAYLTFNLAGNAVRSASWQFRVLSNVAVLRSAAPAGGKQGETKAVVLTASNLRGAGTSVVFANSSGFSRTVPATSVVQPSTVNVSLNLADLDTGTYTLAVQNAGAAASNQVSFSVLPGIPAIDGAPAISPASVVQCDAPATITLNGHNFAKPDAQGRGGSQVMYTPDGGTTWLAVPATVTVNSANRITAVFDTRNAVAGLSYPIQVWNAPGPMKSTQSVSLAVTAGTCP
jgi:MYXO-CTERM domain-containing protein